MSANPFEDENSSYGVLVNDEGQFSLWPTAISVPPGWEMVHADDNRAACLRYIEENWDDMRPRSLQAFMSEHSAR